VRGELEPAPTAARRRDLIGPLIVGYAAVQLVVGAWLLIDPESFFDDIGPYGALNTHYARDNGTFTLALGVALAIAYFRPAWRPGVVGYAFLQYLFHSINHLVDIDKADPKRLGPINFVLLAAGTALLGWMLARILRDARAQGP
jgi:hypothetical protein